MLNIFQRGSRFASNSDADEVFLKTNLQLGLSAPITNFSEASLNGSKTTFSSDNRYYPLSEYLDYNGVGKPLKIKGRDGLINEFSWTQSGSLVSAVTENSGGTTVMTNSYTHDPLIGITQSTDANGRRTKYTYDKYNRLYLRKDHENSIIDRYRYNYRKQPETASIFTSIQITGGINQTCKGIRFSATFDESRSFGEPEYTWTFGDEGSSATCSGGIGGGELPGKGGATTGKSVYHVYAEPGTYTVTVKMTHPEFGKEYSRSISVNIYDQLAPLVVNGTSTVEGCNGGGGHEQDVIPIDGGDGEIQAPITSWVGVAMAQDAITRDKTPGIEV